MQFYHMYCIFFLNASFSYGMYGGLIISALDSGACSADLSSGWRHFVVFLGKTLNLYPESVFLSLGV